MRNLFFHPLIILLVTIIFLLFIFSLRKTAQKSEISSQNVAVLEERIDQLTGEIELEKQALDYANSPLAKEKILRNELLLQKPGEYVLQIAGEENLTTENIENADKSNLEAWKELVF